MEWIIMVDSTLPLEGQKVLVCRDLGDKYDYFFTEWDEEEKRFWKMNNCIAYVIVEDFKPTKQKQ
jgi:hypothetical protein